MNARLFWILLAAASIAPSQIVTNGDFEDVPIGPGFFTYDPTQVPGWTRTGSTGDGLAGRVGYSDDQGSVTVAGHGQQFGMLGGGFSAQATAAMTTTVTQLIPGATYLLTFLIANEGEAINQTLTVSFPSGSSTSPQSFTTKQFIGEYWKIWEPQSMQFVATATTASLQFSVTNQQYDMGFDYVQVSLVGGAPTFQVSPASLSFTASIGGDAPPPQSFSVFLTGGASTTSFGITVDGGPGVPAPSWLSIAPTSGSPPGRLVVTVNQSGLQAGSYSARIGVTMPGNPSFVPVDVAVNLVVSAAVPMLEAVPGYLSFGARAQTPGVLDQFIALRNSGGGGAVSFTAAVTSQSPWLTISAASGQTSPTSATFLHVQANTQGLSVGGYRGLIHLAASSNSVDVPVELFVSDNGSILGVNVTGVRFQSRLNNGTSIVQTVKVLNLGDPATTVNWTAQTVSGPAIVNLGAASGTATLANPGLLPIMLSAGAAQQPVGGAYALVKITASGSLNSPQYVVVVLDQADATTAAKPDPSPQGLVFVAVAGGAAPASQSVTVNVDSNAAVAFQAAASTSNGGTWLSASSSAGTTSATAPAQLTVTANPTGLSAGVYTGEVDIALANSLRAVNVTLIVTPVGSSSSERPSANPRATGCTPARLVLTNIGLVNNFAAPASWPATLVVRLTDDCGNSITNGSVAASFSNGDAPLPLRSDLQSGQYAATWQPGFPTAQTVVTTKATAGSLQPATTQLIGAVASNSFPAPVLAPHGTLHNLNPVVGAALAPGTVAQVFGTGLASQTASPGVLPLATIFNGTQVIVGGLLAPLYFLSSGQLNVEIPSELKPGQQYAIVASANSALTLPDTLDLNPVQPGVAAFSNATIIAQHTDFTLVTAASPAKPNEPIIIYLAGLGATNPTVASGQQAPSAEPLARVTNAATVLVDGQNATVLFAGLTPGAVGLYQIDFTVPANSRSGNLNVIVMQGGVASNTTTLPVSQ